MKSVTFHVGMEDEDFIQYANRHRSGRESEPTLYQDSRSLCEGGREVAREIFLDTWRGVPSETDSSARERKDQVARMYEIPRDRLHIYRKTHMVDIALIE